MIFCQKNLTFKEVIALLISLYTICQSDSYNLQFILFPIITISDDYIKLYFAQINVDVLPFNIEIIIIAYRKRKFRYCVDM